MNRSHYLSDEAPIKRFRKSSNVIQVAAADSEVIDLTESGMIYLNANNRQ
jgi:hypothetical protein